MNFFYGNEYGIAKHVPPCPVAILLDNLLACLPSTSDIEIDFFSLNPNFKRSIHESIWLPIPHQNYGQNASLEIYSQEKVCLSILNQPRGNQSHPYNLTIYLSNILEIFFEHDIFKLKLFDDLCMWVFDLGGESPKPLKIRDWTLSGSKSHF